MAEAKSKWLIPDREELSSYEDDAELNIMQALSALELPMQYCPAETIRKQYRSLARRYHPDNSRTGDAEKFENIQKAYEAFSGFFETPRDFFAYESESRTDRDDADYGNAAEENKTDGWTREFAAYFKKEAAGYAPPSKDLTPDVEAVRKALDKRPIDYEGLLLRAEWLEHNLTDGSCDGRMLLGTLHEVQEVRDSVREQEERIREIAARTDTLQRIINRAEDLLIERQSLTTIGNVRYKASLTRRLHTAMKRADDCLPRMKEDSNELVRIETFCRETVMSRKLFGNVKREQRRLDEVAEYYEDVLKRTRKPVFP